MCGMFRRSAETTTMPRSMRVSDLEPLATLFASALSCCMCVLLIFILIMKVRRARHLRAVGLESYRRGSWFHYG